MILGIFFYNGASNLLFLAYGFLIGLLGGGMMCFLVWLGFRPTYPDSKRATKVFEAMGFENPAEVDMFDIHDAAVEKLYEETGVDGRFHHRKWIYRF